METGRVVLLEIGRAFRHPVQFAGVEFIRVGSYKKKLKDFPEKERALWRIFDAVPFEVMPALEATGLWEGELAVHDGEGDAIHSGADWRSFRGHPRCVASAGTGPSETRAPAMGAVVYPFGFDLSLWCNARRDQGGHGNHGKPCVLQHWQGIESGHAAACGACPCDCRSR